VGGERDGRRVVDFVLARSPGWRDGGLEGLVGWMMGWSGLEGRLWKTDARAVGGR
jgi:hypothetical protein